MVNDLDLLGAGTEAGQRVDQLLQPVVLRDDLVWFALGQRVRLVIQNEGAWAFPVEDVDAPVQEDAIVLEGEGQLGGRAVQ